MADLDHLTNVLDQLSIGDCAKLVPILEEKWGVEAKPPAPVQQGSTPEPVNEVQTEFDVWLLGYGDKKIKVVQQVRKATSLSLLDSKDLVEKAPVAIKEGLSEADAKALRDLLVKQGATAELR